MDEVKATPEEQNTALRMEHQGGELLEPILIAMQQVGLNDRCYAYKARVKNEDGILKKLSRKRKDKDPNYNLYDITDIVGFRVITLFKQEVPGIVRFLLEVIKHDTLKDNNPFTKGSLEEAIVYTANIDSDEVAKEIKELIKESGDCKKEPEIKFSKPGYSSVHLVCRLRHGGVRGLRKEYRVPIEIQIRTVFEDAWGEIDHKYGYQDRREGEPAIEQPGIFTNKHLRVLKSFVDSCIEYADLIKDVAESNKNSTKTSALIKPIGTDAEVHKVLEDASIPASTLAEYMHLRSLLLEGVKLIDSDPVRSNTLLTTASEGFNYIFLKEKTDGVLSEENKHKNEAKVLYYFLRMDQALALITQRNRPANRDAVFLYREIQKEIGNHPITLFRLAQALGRMGNHLVAIKILKDLEAIIAQGKTASLEKFQSTLLDHDYEYVTKSIPKYMGYEYWQIADFHEIELPGGIEAKLIHLNKAYEKTLEGYNKYGAEPPEKESYINNLMFYATEYLKAYGQLKGLRKPKQTINKGDLEKWMDEFLPVKDIQHSDDLNTLDTLVFSGVYLGKPEIFKVAAKRILELHDGKLDTSDERIGAIISRAQDAVALED